MWSGTPIRDTICCCHPLTGVPYLRSRTTQADRLSAAEALLHPWIVMDRSAGGAEGSWLPSSSIANLKRYRAETGALPQLPTMDEADLCQAHEQLCADS